PFAPQTVKEAQSEVGEDIFNALLELGELVSVSSEVVFRISDYQKMSQMVREHLKKNNKITVAETRDLFSTSRRYVLALLEYLDATGVTRREGDYRVLR
ncbi:MAG: SelB C-terminal domain-containing protein, partial [Anaerolineales bacterium]|nr:SelB C-terminal domain-containing protein [Anaerolineales bacterium]